MVHSTISLFFCHYNFCRIHKTLRVTPAMAAGLSDTVHDLEWIVGLVDAITPPPNRPARYKQPKAADPATALNLSVTLQLADQRKNRR